jgi:hypothetical protein
MLVSREAHNHKGKPLVPHRAVSVELPRMTVPRSQSPVKHRLLKSLVLLGWVMPLCGFLWASGPSDPQMYSINLSVIDEKNQPVPDATVAVRSTGGFISTAMTGATGKVTLAVNTAASYSLSIQKKGYLQLKPRCRSAKATPLRRLTLS